MKTISTIIPGLKKKTTVSGRFLSRAFLLVLFISASSFVFSAPSPHAGAPGGDTEKIIKKQFRFPRMLVAQNHVQALSNPLVEVLFTTDGNGNVNFALAKTQDSELKRDVENQFYKLCLPRLKQDVVHSVILNFKTL